LWAQIVALIALVLCSAFFSISETALMALNRHRVRHLARRGNRLARVTLWLLDRTDRVLSLILISNTLINALITALVTAIAISMFGNNETVITAATGIVAFVLIVFAEITPKVIGATYPERIALPTSIVLKPLMALARPAIWFVDLFVSRFLRLLRIRTGSEARDQRLSPEELRSMVLEAGNFIPKKHHSILLNLFDLEEISVEDIMTPRAQIEALNLSVPVRDIVHQLTTCYHNKLPVHDGEINRIVGILHVRKAMALLNEQELTVEHFRQLLTPPYYIPQDTGVFTQLQYFQENHERLALIVDEYGEVQGLVTLEDIIEEMIGEFTTSLPGSGRQDSRLSWDAEASCLVEGTATLRDLNKRLGLSFPLDGPKTLNGLLLELLQDIPDAGVSLKLDNCIIEIVQVQNQAIRTCRLRKLAAVPAEVVDL